MASITLTPSDIAPEDRAELVRACKWHSQRPHATDAVPAPPWTLDSARGRLEEPNDKSFTGFELAALATVAGAYVEASVAERPEGCQGVLLAEREALEDALGYEPQHPDHVSALRVGQIRPMLWEAAMAALAPETPSGGFVVNLTFGEDNPDAILQLIPGSYKVETVHGTLIAYHVPAANEEDAISNAEATVVALSSAGSAVQLLNVTVNV